MVGSVLSAAVSIGTSILGSKAASKSTKQAAQIQYQASQDAIAAQERAAAQTRQDQAPFLDAGKQAQYQLAYLMGTVPEGMTYDQLEKIINKNTGAYGSLAKPFDGVYQSDPAYQKRLTEGQQAIERSAAARGGLLSGATTKALQEFAQQVASDEYASAYNRYVTEQTNLYNSLAGQAGLGLKTAQLLQTSNQNLADQTGNYGTQGANAQAGGVIGAGNIYQSGLQNAGSSLSNFFGSNAFKKWIGEDTEEN